MTVPDRIILCGGSPAPTRSKPDQIVKLDLSGASQNVHLEITDLSRRLAANVPDILADLIEIATYVYCADQAVTRGGEGVLNHGAAWRRRFYFHIPIRKPSFWSNKNVVTAMTETLGFMSEDEYTFQFTQHQNPGQMQKFFSFSESDVQQSDLEEVILFSGGLDSLGGAVQEAVLSKRRIALVSHRSSPKIYRRQKDLVADLTRSCKTSRPLHVPVWVNKKNQATGREYTQRTRTFLYASLAASIAVAFRLNRLRFYENGIVSLNLPINEQAVGTRATRTTHPQVLNGFAKLLSLLVNDQFVVENPFLWMTKTEVVNMIGDAGCAELIKHSISCMHTRDSTLLHTHCGKCYQCIGRRFATLASRYAQSDPPEMYKVDLLTGERKPGVDLTLVESFIRNATELAAMSDDRVIEQFGEISRVLCHLRPLTADEVAEKIVVLHRKHGKEVTKVMDDALAKHTADLREAKLPDTCAIVLAVAEKYRKGGNVAELPVGQRQPGREKPEVDGQPRRPYSERDELIYRIIGDEKFRVLTNEEIVKRYRANIRNQFSNRPTLNALRSCFNRIRRHHGLLKSEDIRKNKNAVNE